MDTETALKISGAACGVWLFREGLAQFVSTVDLSIVRESSLAQIETAIEVVEAVNAAAYSVDGHKTIRCTLAQSAIAGVKKYADGMNFQ